MKALDFVIAILLAAASISLIRTINHYDINGFPDHAVHVKRESVGDFVRIISNNTEIFTESTIIEFDSVIVRVVGKVKFIDKTDGPFFVDTYKSQKNDSMLTWYGYIHLDKPYKVNEWDDLIND